MELETREAIRTLRESKRRYVIVDGEKMSVLCAMSNAIKYHHMDIEEVNGELVVNGTDPV